MGCKAGLTLRNLTREGGQVERNTKRHARLCQHAFSLKFHGDLGVIGIRGVWSTNRLQMKISYHKVVRIITSDT